MASSPVDLLRLAREASGHASAECRELSAQLLWHSAQLCQQQSGPAALQAEAVSSLCVLLTDVCPAVRGRACVLLASMPCVSAERLAHATSKQPARSTHHA